MSIKFNCPHCQKSLRVNVELAGKKARCPGCRQPLRVPTLEPPPAAPDVEALAASALADEPPPVPAPEEPKQLATISFTCPQCDEKVEVSADLAGKQTPCPECRRIVKVPLPQKIEPKDWRKADPRGPAAGLRKDEQTNVPEGAWGTAVSKSTVSRQSLEEAEAVPIVKVRRTVGQKIGLGVKATLAVGVVGLAYWGFKYQNTKHTTESAFDKALEILNPKAPRTSGLDNLAAAELHRAAGDYHLRLYKQEERDSARKDFSEARAKLMTADASREQERYALLIDLAVSQVDLGGTQEEIDRKVRLKWDVVNNDLRQTLTKLDAAARPETREEALRAVSRKLIAKGQADLAATAATLLGSAKDRSEMEAVVGWELLLAGQQQAAETRANSAAKPYDDKPRKDENAPSLLALLVALGQEERAGKILISVPQPDKVPLRLARLGYAQGWAYQDKWERARQLADAQGPPLDRLEALIALIAIATLKKPAEAPPLIDGAAQLLEGDLQNKPVSPWLLLRLVRLAAGAGQGSRVSKFVDDNHFADAGLRARAQLALLQADRETSPHVDAEALETAAKQPQPSPLILEFLSRYNTRQGSAGAVMKAVAGWEPEALRAFGYIGVALGEQDGRQ
jgi:hypothetical protein